ncbi:hypothetical protein RUM43_004996 [Polyplax serrata]|uniref:TEP1-F n=1 Tax=Polyplax serrata TaxID=468196 RepID=A0AAN8SCU9_POLSC
MDINFIVYIFFVALGSAAAQIFQSNNPEGLALQDHTFRFLPQGNSPGNSQNFPNQYWGGPGQSPDSNYPTSGGNWGPQNSGNQYWDQGPFGLHTNNNSIIIREATYFIVAGKIVRPGTTYRISVMVLQAPVPLTVRANIQRNGVEQTADSKDVKEGIPETLLLRMPRTIVSGHYKLRVEGTYDSLQGGTAFVNETTLTFSQRSMTIFIQTDKPVYMQGQTVNFRTVPITTELRPFDDSVDVFMLDPNRNIMRRWLSRQSNLGTVSLSYQLSDQPVYGEWTIQIVAQGQIEEGTFLVEEYYQTRFEVNVTMPAFFFDSDKFIYGTVVANYTNGAPVRGNLTLKASIRPIKRGPYGDRPQPVEKFFTFDESYPFWYPRPQDNYYYYQDRSSNYNYYGSNLPYLTFFNGVYNFKYPMSELAGSGFSLDGVELTVTATVGDRFLDEVIQGYSTARIYNSSVKVTVLGGSPQVFKPAMPFTLFIAVSYQDNTALQAERLRAGRVEVTATVGMHSGRQRIINFDPREDIKMSSQYTGVWELDVDLKSELSLGENRLGRGMLNDIRNLKLQVLFRDPLGQDARTEAYLATHYSPQNRHIKVTSSTQQARVGEYFILHVQSNYYMELFNYIVLAKGMILLTGQENMKATVRTFAIPLSVEMAPEATVVVYNVALNGDITADSLTFPVNGISRNNFTVFINNRKARTGKRVEVAIYGEPGAYVGLSGIDKSFYTMQAGNELTYSKVIDSMSRFDEETNGTFMFSWRSHEGNPDENVYFPSNTFGVDANRTFEYNGLIVFSDALLPRIPNYCDSSQGFVECLSGGCYHLSSKCNGHYDCEDGSDENKCPSFNVTDFVRFRKLRFNRIQRQYENVWLWKDINIGPHGRYIFDLPVPKRPVHWMVSAFSMSPSVGFGMLQKPIEYVGVLPFFIEVEMPTTSRQGEQIGIRVAVFNYMTTDIEATVILAGSNDYKFVHVEMDGIVRSYNPRTTFGEHQFFVYIPKQDAATVYIPIVPTRLGDIEVTVFAQTLIGKDSITRTLRVEADGLPQFRHQSILLDLSNRAYVFQYLHVNVTDTPIIPYSEDRYYVFGSNRAFVSIVGDVVGPIFPTMPVNATSLLYLPMDCAEQNIFSFSANLYTTLYMRYVNQRNKTQEKEAFFHMNVAYQRQLSYMNPDGNQSSPSVWLTAYCARVFQEASFYEWENYIYIDPKVISKAVAWVLDHQTPDGSFYEVTWLPDRKTNTSSFWPNDYIRMRNLTLTAHVLITLDTVKDLSGGLGSRLSLAQTRAMKWLEKNIKLINETGDPYEVAIVAYALLLSKSASAEAAFGILARHARSEGGYTYWGKEAIPPPPTKIENQKVFSLPRLPYKYDSTNIEATAYALLVYTARQEWMVDEIVSWLTAQRLTDGGWASTQDTAVAMKALIEYTNRKRIREVSSLTVTIEATALPGEVVTFYVNDENRAQLQTLEIPRAWGTVKVQAKGAGYAILQMTVQYNVDIAKFQTQPPVRSFDLRTRANFHGRNQSHITYRCCQRWTYLEESVRSGMAVLDVTIPTGYIIQQQDLDAYIHSRKVRNLQRARFQDRKVLFYFDYLDNYDICVDFTVERWYPVANMSRYLPIRVYDYYAPERFNETIFDSLPTYILNICEVCGSSQCPYCPIYNLASILKASSVGIVILAVFVLHRNLGQIVLLFT